MCPSIFSFDISGKITNVQLSGDDYNHDLKVIELLNSKKELIEREIEYELKSRLSDEIILKSVTVQLSFQKGSILALGLIVLETMATVGGAFSLLEFMIRTIRDIINRNIRYQLPSNPKDYNISIDVIPRRIPTEESESHPVEKIGFFNIALSKGIIYATFINFVLIFGGTLFGAYQVTSAVEKHEEARNKIKEAQEKLVSASQLLKSTKLNYQLKSRELDAIVDEITGKKDDIISELSEQSKKNRLIIAETQQNIAADSLAAISLRKDIKSINDDISFLQKENVRFGIREIWTYMNGFLQFILILISIPVIVSYSFLFSLVLSKLIKVAKKIKASR
jgi:hypothetical protein